MSTGGHDEGETREVPLDELLLTAQSPSGELPAEEGEDDDFVVGPKQPVLGDYVLLRRIGAGGNGRVFEARHRRMERLVALKMLSAATMRNPEAVRRFRREMKAAAKLFHPNIVTAFDAGEQDGVHYLVMEYVEGQSLTTLIQQHGTLSVDKAVDYVTQAARGLQYAHGRNVVHRDVKPSNLILDSQGVVKILDLGTARFQNDASQNDLTEAGMIMGTVNYMAPEQARAAHDVDHRCDIYSLGCTLYYLLTGEALYDGNVMQVLLAHAEQPPPSVRQLRPEVPDWLDKLLQRVLAKRPADRPQSMEELIGLLQSGAAGAVASRASLKASSDSKVGAVLCGGVDLGTSKAVMARVGEDHQIQCVSSGGSTLLPTVVSLSGMNIQVGAAAMEQIGDYEHVAWRIKRQLGRTLYDHKLDGASYPPEVLLALVLGRLANDAAGNLSELVATVPAVFNDAQRRAVQHIGYMAGVQIVDLINEPTAAALSYLHAHGFPRPERPQRWLCIDLGGGKLDVAVMSHAGAELRTQGVAGSLAVGGCEWDDVLAEMMADQIVADDGPDPRLAEGAFREVTRNCQLAKHQLSKRGETTMAFSGGRGRVLLKMTADRYRQVTATFLRRLTAEVKAALAMAETSWEDVDLLLLSGQATRAPTILDALKRSAGRANPSLVQLGPEAAARGAAIWAQWRRLERSGGEIPLAVTQIATHSLGVVGIDSRTQRKRNAVLIPRGTPLPAATRRSFKTSRDGQESLMVQMVQGEHAEADQCTPVGRCVINDLPPQLAAGTPFQVEFRCAANGRVTVHVESPQANFKTTRELVRDDSLSNQNLSRYREWVETMVLCSSLG